MGFRMKYLSSVMMTLICGLPLTATASPDYTELSLEQLLEVRVTSACKFNQAAGEAPSAVQVIGQEEIQRHGWRTLSEALNTLPGIYVSNDKVYDFQGARGFQIPGDYNTRFLLLVDGQRNNDSIFQQAMTGAEGWLDMSAIERIEYIPGPGSAIYGSNAMLGVINVITRRANYVAKTQLGVHVSQLGVSGVNMLTSQTLQGDDADTGIFLQFSADRQAGRDRQYADPLGQLIRADGSVSPDGIAHGLDSGNNRHLLARVDRGEWSFRLINHERTVHPSSAPYLALFNDPSIAVNDGGTQLNASFSHALSDSSSLVVRLGYTDWHYRATYPYLDPLSGYYRNYDDYRGQALDGEVHYLGQGTTHHLLAGMDFSQDLQARQQNFNSIALPGVPDVNINPLVSKVGMFVQDEWRLSSQWLLNLGGRIDTITHRQASFSPRLGAIWHPDADWTLKLLSGRAYRAPNAYESQFSNGVTYLNNPALQAETIQTTEAVVEWLRKEHTRWQFSIYNNHIQNLIQQVATAGGLQFQNVGHQGVQGVELGVEQSTPESMKLRASFTLNRSHNGSIPQA